jgi:hypothetical protein
VLVGAEGEHDESNLQTLQEHALEGDCEGVAVKARASVAGGGASRLGLFTKLRNSSCFALRPLERKIALCSHWRPKISNSPPTPTLKTSIGSAVSAGPRAATIAESTTVATLTPVIVEDQLRVVPTASTIVNASTASTA